MPKRPTPTITEVLPEPGSSHLWVTFDDGLTRRVDLAPLMAQDSHRLLQLTRALERVSIDSDGRGLRWPGGAGLQAASILNAPDGPQHVLPVAVIPSSQRYRPLLPYLKHHVPEFYLRPDPIEAQVLTQMLGLSAAELQRATEQSRAPISVTIGRLYDVAVLLQEHFARDHLKTLLQRPWLTGIKRLPGQPLFHTMRGCLTYGRPDLIEHPCMLLLTGALP